MVIITTYARGGRIKINEELTMDHEVTCQFSHESTKLFISHATDSQECALNKLKAFFYCHHPRSDEIIRFSPEFLSSCLNVSKRPTFKPRHFTVILTFMLLISNSRSFFFTTTIESDFLVSGSKTF